MRSVKTLVRRRWPRVTMVAAVALAVLAVASGIVSRDIVTTAALLVSAVAVVAIALLLAQSARLQRTVDRMARAHQQSAAQGEQTTDDLRRLRRSVGQLSGQLSGRMTRQEELIDQRDHRTEEQFALVSRELGVLRLQADNVTAEIVDTSVLAQSFRAELHTIKRHLGDDRDEHRQELADDSERWTALRASLEEALVDQSALHSLYTALSIAGPMPTMGQFAVAPATMLRLIRLVLASDKPMTIVECGSGATTVWLALACRTIGAGRVIALEHHPKYAALTRQWVTEAGLDDWAEVRLAPLEEQTVGSETMRWFDPQAWADLPEIDLLLVDGPPKSTGPMARYPAVPLLGHVLRDGSLVAADDTHRPTERAILSRWLSHPPSDTGLEVIESVGRTTLLRVSHGGDASGD